MIWNDTGYLTTYVMFHSKEIQFTQKQQITIIYKKNNNQLTQYYPSIFEEYYYK